MNKTLRYIIIFAGVLFGLWTIGRLTNTFQWFSASTVTNYPTIKQGDRFFASNLIEPKRFDFICYYATTPEFGRQIWTHRLCGFEGDTIEFRDGYLAINNEYADSSLSLAHYYIMPVGELDKVKAIEKVDESTIHALGEDSVGLEISDNAVMTHSIKAKRYVFPKDYIDEFIQGQFSTSWNSDNFGPVVVPKGKYFVVGDNRQNSRDSRYIGFVDKSDYVATVIGR